LGTTLSGLTPATGYTARVYQVCGVAVGDTSYPRSVNFTTQCATFSAPFSETFVNNSTPLCWNQTATTGGPWVFSGNPGYSAAGTQSHTADGSSFTWMDFSGTDNDVVLELPNVDISALAQPNLDFWFKSIPDPNNANNILRVEAYDGLDWNLITTIQQDSPDWEYPLTVAGHLFSIKEMQIILNFIDFKAPNSLESNESSSAKPSVLNKTNIKIINMPTKPMLSLKEISPSTRVSPSKITDNPKGTKFHS
jgi:hypothetical protein